MREMRLRRLHELVVLNGIVEVDAAAARLDVSRETIRRDLAALASQGLVRRTRGGATMPGRLTELDPSIRTTENHVEKVAIARYVAANLVQDHMSVALDAGTTTTEVARCLRGRNITVVTASVPVITELAGSRTTVVVIGGVLRNRSQSMVGPIASEISARFQCDIAFISGPAIDARVGLTDTDVDGVSIKQKFLDRAEDSYAVLDHTKLGRTAFAAVCPPSALTGLVTDSLAPEAELLPLQDTGLEIFQAPLTVKDRHGD